MSFGPNCFFVDAQHYDRFGIEDDSPVKMFKAWKFVPKGGVKIPPGRKFLKIDAFRIPKRYIHTR